jgi:uncharacterized membrane protein
MADIAIITTIVLARVGALLSAGLLYIFLQSYRRVRAPLTMGLILVSLFFLAQNVLSFYAYLTMMTKISAALTPFMLGIMAFGDVALAVLLYTSRQ